MTAAIEKGPGPVTTARPGARDLRAAFGSAERWLSTNRDGINAINVYPVPDGDTGTNMLLTLRAALRGVEGDPASVGVVAQQMARAALLGARGNSGVILSQMIRGFAEALDGRTDVSAEVLLAALVAASDTADRAVSQPVEGTMLTVLREATARATEHLDATPPPDSALRTLVEEAYASVERTPELLPRLREAGVVDAGGAGVAVILEGLVAYLEDTPLPPTPRYAATGRVQTDAVDHEGHGYCTEFIVLGAGLDLRGIEAELAAAGGDSVLVVGDAGTVHVHVHMEDPGPALSIGARAGALDAVKVENMQAQHEAWMAAKDGNAIVATARPRHPVGLVAIARGPGLADAFRDLGADVVIELDGGSKASAGEILEAARHAEGEHVLVLPNDGDILMAAEAAAREAAGFLTVVPSSNAVTGLAAAIYYRPQGALETVIEEMTAALDDVRAIEVSTAVREAAIDGIPVQAGDAIAFVDGRLHAARPTHDTAFLAALEETAEGASLVTVYLGADADGGAATRLEAQIVEAFPQLEVEVLPGGQPHYVYIASVE